MFQDYIARVIRVASILTTGYVAAIQLDYTNDNPQAKNQLNLLLALTLGSLTDALLKIEYSDDGQTWYQETFLDVNGALATASLGEYKFASSGNYIISVPIKAAYVRASLKGEGTVTGSSASLVAITGVA